MRLPPPPQPISSTRAVATAGVGEPEQLRDSGEMGRPRQRMETSDKASDRIRTRALEG